MAVINITPDSFHTDSRVDSTTAALTLAERMLAAGADWLDIGGESTRPGAEPVDVAEELARVIPIIEAIRGLHPDALISIDTRRAEIAAAALDAGADMVNDVSGLRDPLMRDLIVQRRCAVCIMHMLGKPRDMQVEPVYDDVIGEVAAALRQKAEEIVALGHPVESICLDPGIGFGKALSDNLSLLSAEAVEALRGEQRFAVLWGVSRKSMFGDLLERDTTGERLAGTLAVATHAQAIGVDMLRVHDVSEHADVGRTMVALRGAVR